MTPAKRKLKDKTPVKKRTTKSVRAETGTSKARKRTAKKVPEKPVEKLEQAEVSAVIDDRPPQSIGGELPEMVYSGPRPRSKVVRDAPGGPYIDWGGKHHGKAYSALTKSYLEWMINANHSAAMFAREELRNRNTNPSLNVRASPHAIDMASLQLFDLFQNTRKNFEGLYSWLCRIVADGLILKTNVIENGVTAVEYEGHIFNLNPYHDAHEHPVRRNGFEIGVIQIAPGKYKVGFNAATQAASDQAGRSQARRTKNVGAGIR